MLYKTLGKSDLNVSQISFGCMSLKDTQTENERIIHRAIELGINTFDTADLYDKGMNEVSVGKALFSKRSEVIIATKVGNIWRKDGSSFDWNPRKEHIITAVEESLKRLQTDYIDLYQLHGGTIEDPIDETIEAFEQLQKQGKIRYYGISSIRPNVIREYVKRSNMVSVMLQYSLLDRRPEEAVLTLLKEKNIGVLARGSVASGLLVNKPAKAYLGFSAEQVGEAANAIKTISGTQRNEAQTSIRYVLSNNAIISAVVGIRTIEQLEEAVKTMTTPVLNDDELAMLQNSIPLNTYEQHR